VANPNTTDSLDLYAKVEDLLENEEAIALLYAYYYDTLSNLSFESLLDVGCGSGAYLEALQRRFPHAKAKGIDLSPVMVERAKKRGIDAQVVDLCKLEGRYDVITAVFDMMNYLPSKALEGFFGCIREHLNEGGIFMFDINSLYGFEQVAVGAYVVEDAERFLAIDSDFDGHTYEAVFTLFEKKENGCHIRTSQTIYQYYHTIERMKEYSQMQLIVAEPISLYGLDEADKWFVVLKK
jgi:predicted TPR repeat methyltransferase